MNNTYQGNPNKLPDIGIYEKQPNKLKDALQTGLFLTDWAQTRHLARNPDKFYEQNSILGKHPHPDKVDAYFALTGLAQLYLANKLPEKWKEPFQNLMIGIESGAVGNNVKLGIKAKF